MKYRKSLILSSIAHIALLALLQSSIWSLKKPTTPRVPLEAHLIVKKQKNKDYLPKKPKAPMPPPVIDDKITKEKPSSKEKPPKKSEKAIIPIAEDVKKKPAKKNKDYTKALGALSESFARELAEIPEEEPEGEVIPDSSYFDQVYSLIKESFIVPPHLNGPSGQNLRAVIRIFLARDGNLNKLLLINSSGDEHFDKAVTEGTKRVNNFGAVPVYLQDTLRDFGLVVELCPFKCAIDGE